MKKIKLVKMLIKAVAKIIAGLKKTNLSNYIKIKTLKNLLKPALILAIVMCCLTSCHSIVVWQIKDIIELSILGLVILIVLVLFIVLTGFKCFSTVSKSALLNST